jgi:predicted transcriptional regulator
MDAPFRNTIISFIAIFFLVAPITAAAFSGNAIVVEPGYDFLRNNPPDDVVKISFWELSPKSMIFFTLLAISPVLVYPAELFFTFRIYSLLGVRRLTKRRVLDHEGRKIIYELVQENPGIQLAAIMDATRMNRGTVRYHLNRLETTGKITYISVSGRLMYYDNNGAYTDMEKKIIWHLKSDSRAKILFYLLESPTGTRHEISEAVGVSGPTVTWHMYRLFNDEIATQQKDGKFTRYLMNPEAVPVVRKYLQPDKTSPLLTGN